MIGTPHYMAPEQCQGEEADARSDVYSLGIVLYELLTGVAPFLAKTPTGVAIKHVTEKPRPLHEIQPGVTENVERVVLRALEKEPSARQQTALELAREFEAAIRADGVTDALIRSGEQAQVDSDTLRLAKSQKTDLISKPQETGATRMADRPPQSFDTSITPPSGTDQLKEAATGQVAPPKQTAGQRSASDPLRTRITPPTEFLPPNEEPPPYKPAVIDPLRTNPAIPADAAAKYDAPAGTKPRVNIIEAKAEEKKPKPQKDEKKIEIPLAAPPPVARPTPVQAPLRMPAPMQAKSRAPLFVGLGAAALVIVAIAVWSLSGKQET
ncbi:MAG: serine/threonine protein kinase, partial [Burkholderiales bacterium]